jgi:hypothetical protein
VNKDQGLNSPTETGQNGGVNGHPGKIEIFAPFGAAYEWMVAMLFRPFDVGRWLTIAFAAFLAGSIGGGGGNFGRLGRFGEGDWKYSATTHGNMAIDWSTWIIGLVIFGVLIAVVLVAVLMWVSSRGRFIFTDCVVKNRAAIVEPWREFRREGNSYFLFSLAIGFGQSSPSRRLRCLLGCSVTDRMPRPVSGSASLL